jgi:hypothetical protein
MARKKGPRDYFEPWVATRSVKHGSCPEFKPESTIPEEVQQQLIDAWGRADRDADWNIWGSRMAEPRVCIGLGGNVSVMGIGGSSPSPATRGSPTGHPTRRNWRGGSPPASTHAPGSTTRRASSRRSGNCSGICSNTRPTARTVASCPCSPGASRWRNSKPMARTTTRLTDEEVCRKFGITTDNPAFAIARKMSDHRPDRTVNVLPEMMCPHCGDELTACYEDIRHGREMGCPECERTIWIEHIELPEGSDDGGFSGDVTVTLTTADTQES